jgi:hypothetical protein
MAKYGHLQKHILNVVTTDQPLYEVEPSEKKKKKNKYLSERPDTYES